MLTAPERSLRNALEIGASREVDSKEGLAIREGLLVVPRKRSDVGTPQLDLNGAVGEALIPKPIPQRQCTKLIFDVRIDNRILD